MTDEHNGANGWWQASDGKWYPPETHPDYTPPAPTSPTAPAGPSFQPPPPAWTGPLPRLEASPAPPAPAPAPHGYPADGLAAPAATSPSAPGAKRWWIAGVALVVAIGAAVGIASSGDDGVDPISNSASAETADRADNPDQAAADQSSTDPSDDGEANQPDPTPSTDDEPEDIANNNFGSRDAPFGYGATVPVVFDSFGDADGSVWNVTVEAPRDITAEVLAANDFNDDPPEGVVFVGFEATMTLASANKEPLSPGFNFAWEILGGSTSAAYDEATLDDIFGCGVVDADFNRFAEVFVAGTLSGTVCIPVPIEDVTDPGTQIAMNFNGGERVVFAPGGGAADPALIDSPGRAADSLERAYGVVVPVEFDVFGDADRSVWNVRLSRPRDMTDQVLQANSFNDEPPDGVVYAGFDVELTLASATKVPLSAGFNVSWEILGGSTNSVFNASTMDDLFGCGAFPDEFDNFAEAFVGGTISGTVCIPLPIEDLDHPDTGAAMNLQGSRVLFRDDADAPEPAEVEPRGGPAGLDPVFPLSESTVIEWDVLGDADRSTWTTTVAPWRDITAEILAANSFNDRPPEGVAFVGFDVELTLEVAGKEPLSTGFNISWEILGGSTLRVYRESGLTDLFGCGVFDDEFDDFAEIFVGGTLSGTVCVPLPIEDIDHPDTRVAINVQDERFVFGPS